MNSEQPETMGFRWSYTPSDFFKEPVILPLTACDRDYEALFENGEAEVKIPIEFYDSEEYERSEKQLLIELRIELDNRMWAAQEVAQEFKSYKLSQFPSSTIPPFRRPSGKPRKLAIYTETASFSMTFGQVNLIHRDNLGNIIPDPRQQRLVHYAKVVSKYRGRDKVLDKMLSSMRVAREQPAHEFVHIYEVLDTLETFFKKKGKHICNNKGRPGSLDIDYTTSWGRLAALTNDEQIRQARHGGKSDLQEEQRDATEIEREEANKLAREIISAYVVYLETII